jgi:hypothetical protein
MPDYLGAVGLLFFMFFLVAAATESILELFRGVLERFGLTWLKADKSLEDAVKMGAEFLPPGSEARGKIAALQDVVKDVRAVAADKKVEIADLKAKIDALAPGARIDAFAAAEVNSIALHVKEALDKSERTRVFVLRVLSALIAVYLAYQADLDALRSMIQAYPNLFKGAFGSMYEVTVQGEVAKVVSLGWAGNNVGLILTGVAAAGGSSYWHDKLDNIRNLKGAQEQLKKLTS